MAEATYRIVPIAEEHAESFRDCVDEVARERKYLAMLQGFPLAESRKFVLETIKSGTPAFVALAERSVVGWCDIIVKPRDTLKHSGVLGMGVRQAWRGRGAGRNLIQAALAAAWERGLTRVELTVRADNTRAKRLYESAGFKTEGQLHRHMLVDGAYFDSYLMAVLV